MKKINWAINVYFPVIALILTAILFFWLWNENSGLNNALEVKKKELRAARTAGAGLKKLEKQAESFREEEEKLRQKIPLNDKQPLDLIKTLIRIAREAGLKEIDFDLKEKTARANNNVSGAGAAGSGMGTIAMVEKSSFDAQSDIQPQPISLEISCQGTFSQLLLFLEKTAKLERVVIVEKVEIERKKELTPRQKIFLRLITYTF
jgi:Tfp pilus assembly protein PilO